MTGSNQAYFYTGAPAAPGNTRYYVGTGAAADWNATGPTPWSTTPNGANNASTPTASNDVVFDANSLYDCTIGTAAVCRSLTATNYAHNLQLLSTTLTIGDGSGGAAAFPGVGGSFTNTGTLVFASTASNGGAGWSIAQPNYANFSLGNVTFNGAGGYWKAATQLNMGAVTLTHGTLDLGSLNTAVSSVTAATGTSALTFGTAILSVAGNIDLSPGTVTVTASGGAQVAMSAVAVICNLTSGSSNLDVVFTSAPTAATAQLTATNLRNITVSRPAGSTLLIASSSGTATYASLTASSSNATINFAGGFAYHFSGATPFTLSGADATHTLTLHGNALNTNVTATTAATAVVMSYINVSNFDMSTGSGAGNTYTANNSVNGGGNTGIVFPTILGGVITDRLPLFDQALGVANHRAAIPDSLGLLDQATAFKGNHNWVAGPVDRQGLTDLVKQKWEIGAPLGLLDGVTIKKTTALPTIVTPATYATTSSFQTAGFSSSVYTLKVATVVRWRFDDTTNGEYYVFDHNPAAADGAGEPSFHSVVTQGYATQQGPAMVVAQNEYGKGEFGGTILTQGQLDVMWKWYYKGYPIKMTDDLGRVQFVMFESFTPTRVRSAGNQWKHTYKMTYSVLQLVDL